MYRRTLTLIAATAVALSPCAALADDDRPPTDEERAAIERVLREEGFVSWDQDIELDDGHWEVDDARMSDGTKYDLELEPETLKIVRRDRDDD